jgi:hypothetical protein
MVISDYKIWVQTESFSVLTWLSHGYVASLKFWPHHLHLQNLTTSAPLRKSKLHLSFGLSLCPFKSSLHGGSLRLLISFPLSIFAQQSPSSASLLRHHENHLISVDSSLNRTHRHSITLWKTSESNRQYRHIFRRKPKRCLYMTPTHRYRIKNPHKKSVPLPPSKEIEESDTCQWRLVKTTICLFLSKSVSSVPRPHTIKTVGQTLHDCGENIGTFCFETVVERGGGDGLSG